MSELPPMRDITVKTMATVMASHGYDKLVMVMIRDGEDGGILVSSCGLGARNKMWAESLRDEISKIALGFERSDEARALDKMVDEAKQEMATGPENDPDYGKKLIIPVAERIKERNRKPR